MNEQFKGMEVSINMGLIQQFVASNGKGEIVPEVVSVTSLNRIQFI